MLTSEKMLELVVKNGLGIQMTIETLDNEELEEVKQFDQSFFNVIIETEKHSLFCYFDDEESYLFDKISGKLSMVQFYENAFAYMQGEKVEYINEDYLDDERLEEEEIEIDNQGVMICEWLVK